LLTVAQDAISVSGKLTKELQYKEQQIKKLKNIIMANKN